MSYLYQFFNVKICLILLCLAQCIRHSKSSILRLTGLFSNKPIAKNKCVNTTDGGRERERKRGRGKDDISRSGFLLQSQTYPDVCDCSGLHNMLLPPAYQLCSRGLILLSLKVAHNLTPHRNSSLLGSQVTKP